VHHYQAGIPLPPVRHLHGRADHPLAPHDPADGVNFVIGEVDRVDATANTVALTDGRTLGYDYLVIASGTTPRPDQTPGMLGSQWRRSIFDFYTLQGSAALATAMQSFDHGRLVVHITDMPIKCPVAPLEFTFLADAWLRERGLRDRGGDRVRDATAGCLHQTGLLHRLGYLLNERKIKLETDYLVERIDVEKSR